MSGSRAGVVLEEELDDGQRFHNVYEETKFRAERLVQDAARTLPVTILRPGVIVGDSRTGEIDKFDGPYYLIVLIVASPLDVHLPLPGRGTRRCTWCRSTSSSTPRYALGARSARGRARPST